MGSGTTRPIFSACGTIASTNFCRSSSFVYLFIFHFTEFSVLGLSASLGPNIITLGHHHLFKALWAISFCSTVPLARVSIISYPWRWWKLSSLHILIIARAYGPYEHRQRGIWFIIAAPSTSHPMAPISAHAGVGELKIDEYFAFPDKSSWVISILDFPRVSAAQ